MEKQLQQLFTRLSVSTHRNQGILIAPVMDIAAGFRVAKEVLYELVDKKTALFLSGGKTPKELYRKIAEEKKLLPGVVGQVDERYGKPLHESSNELMFQESGFLDYLKREGIEFHSMLNPRHSRESHSTQRDEPSGSDSKSGNPELEWIPGQARDDNVRKKLAENYDQLLRRLFTVYQKSIATLGIGSDGHTAGVAPNRGDFTNLLFSPDRKLALVSEYNDETGSFKERITMTFLGLSMMDYLLVFVFGDDKKEALEKMFVDGKEEDIPARFLKRPEIAAKTLIITDQNV